MKQYLNDDQTAKLMELGFEKPTMKNIPTSEGEINEEWYSIGELLSFLPKVIDCNGFKHILYIFVNQDAWDVEYANFLGELYSTYRTELIDAVFDMVIILKEEGVI